MEKLFPIRKFTRLKSFDYSSVGAYFVTVCTEGRKQILSEIVKTTSIKRHKPTNTTVGEGLAPPEYSVKLKPCGDVVVEQLRLLEKRFPNVSVEDYIIMPDHLHVIILIHKNAGGASPSPTLNNIVCSFKSLSSLICKHKYCFINSVVV